MTARSASPARRSGRCARARRRRAVVRETRSPVPARSTAESGSASTWRMKSSRRSREDLLAESTNEERRANQVSIVWAITNPTSTAITRSTCAAVVPSWTAWTSPPSSTRPDQAGEGGQRVQAEHDGEAAAVAAQPDGRVPADLGPVGDRKPLAHRDVLPRDRERGRRRSTAAARGACRSRRRVRRRAGRRVGAGRAAAGWRSSRRSCGPGARLQPLGDPGLGVRVDRAGRLDQDQDLGVGQQRAGQDQPLPLTAGERAAALLDLRRRGRSGSASRTSSALATAIAASTLRRPRRDPAGRARPAGGRRTGAGRSR